MITPGQLAGQATLCCWRHLQSLVLLLTEKNLEVRRSMLGGWKIVNVTGEHMWKCTQPRAGSAPSTEWTTKSAKLVHLAGKDSMDDWWDHTQFQCIAAWTIWNHLTRESVLIECRDRPFDDPIAIVGALQGSGQKYGHTTNQKPLGQRGARTRVPRIQRLLRNSQT